MQKLWQRLCNLVKRYVPDLRKPKFTGDKEVGKDWYRIDEQAFFPFFKKEGQEQRDQGLLPRFVAGIDPYQESRELEVNIFRFGGELGPHIAQGDLPEPCYDTEKYYRLNLGGAHDVRQFIDDPRLPWFGERVTECMGDRSTAFALALKTGRGEEQTQESPGKISE